MSLRNRLVLSLLALTALGLVIYGVGTYRAFADAELDRLDEDLVASVDLVARELTTSLRTPLQDRLRSSSPVVVAPGTYAELRAPDGSAVATLQVARSEARPDLDALEGAGDGRIETVASREGDGRWRVVAEPTVGGGRLLVAAPMTAVERSLDRLLAIEVAAGGVLLVLLGGGAGLLLRRELKPLERIADTAGSITAGELHRRVPVAERPTPEVGRLAHALNGMLDELEGAFHDREASEARLRRFLADASHELRTPLTSIQGFAELFRLEDEEQRQLDLAVIMRRIEEEADRMRSLVEDLLLLARLDETRPPEREEVDLAVLAADACSDAVATAPDRPVHLDAPEPVVTVADPGHLRQALGNLVGNALRHTPEGTAIEVSAVADERGRPTVTVRDHGPGLGEEASDRVFDRFWQADPARAGTGAGLGLSIVAAVAAEHGGTVEAGDHPEGGARFVLRLPARPSPPPPPS